MKGLPVLHNGVRVDVGAGADLGAGVGVVFDTELGAAPPWAHQPTVEWQVVGQCNYDCSYCIQSKKHRVGIPADEELRRAIAFFARLPTEAGPWEIKTTGGEPFSFRGFLDVVVNGLMDDTPHRMSTLTNLSAPPAILRRFAARTRGRLSVVSSSLHLEHTEVSPFLQRLDVLREAVDDDVRIVVNCVLVPDRLAAVAAAQAAVVARGFRFFPQLMKVKGGVFAYSPAQMQQVRAIVGDLDDAVKSRSANLAPAYTGQRCFAGARYLVVTKEGDAWSCRTAKRHREGYLGRVFDADDRDRRGDSVRLHPGARACPYTICPCTTPANRGMIEGVPARLGHQFRDEDD